MTTPAKTSRTLLNILLQNAFGNSIGNFIHLGFKNLFGRIDLRLDYLPSPANVVLRILSPCGDDLGTLTHRFRP